jgi:PAS domain S-box-containing protein
MMRKPRKAGSRGSRRRSASARRIAKPSAAKTAIAKTSIAKTSIAKAPTANPAAANPTTAKASAVRRGSVASYEPLPALQLIYDTAPIGLAFLTTDCRYVQINQRLTEICGISVAEHIGRTVRETVPQVADDVERIVQSILRGGGPVTGVEVRGQRADRRNADHVWITHWHPVKNPDGRIVGVNVVAEDVTERKRAEEALRESETRFRELADNISQMAWTADPSGARTWFNKRWFDFSGMTLEEMKGRGWEKLHHPDHLGRVLRHMRQCFADGKPWEDTFPLRGRDDRYRWFLVRALPIRNDAGAVVRWLGTNTDVTERIEAEKALRDSEARFRELADNISQFAWTADHTGWIYWYNKRWHDYTGTTLADMQGWGWQKVHHPDHVDRVVVRIRESFATGRPWEDTFPLRGRDGSYRWFLSRALPIRDGDGEVIRWFGTNTDITDQLAAEQALRDLNETLEQRVEAETRERLQIWNVSQDLLAVSDLEGRILSVNPAWTATLGWSEAELIGRNREPLMHPDDRERAHAGIAALAAGEKLMHFENRMRHKNGTYRWVSWKAAPDRGRIYAMGRDITELKQAEEELRQAHQELAQFGRRTTLAAMTASIAHEIKQPLGAIVANAAAALRWLARTPPSLDDVREALNDIEADGHRASEVIQSVRAVFSKGDQGGVPLDANELIRQTLAIVRGELEAAGIAVQLDLATQLPLVPAHRGQLQQVILNVVANAADAMRAVTDRERILKVRSEPSERGGVALWVEDSGPGIDPDNVDRIFEAFYTTKSDGMGMGLAICRSIVEAHGGSLSVSPGAPHGSAFRVVLPVD